MAQTTTNTEMKTFPAPLLRLILSGGSGLPPAYGPVIRADGQEFVWDGKSGRAFAVSAANGAVISDDLTVVEGWRLLLDGESPWLDRLAMVVAWMLKRPAVGAWVGGNDHFPALTVLLPRGALLQSGWLATTGTRLDGFAAAPDLPTLPARLATLPPVAAIPLALYDLPEVAARVAIVAG
jgi:hypothetical protein